MDHKKSQTMMTNSIILQLALSTVLSSLVIASSSSSSPTVVPWWEDSSIVPHKVEVSENYDWDHRDTGISSTWQTRLALWSHYNRTELATRPLQSWTEGLMVKNLCKINETAFELHSIYERSAVGQWMDKGAHMKVRDTLDGLLEHSHVFHKTPNRVSVIGPPLQKLPDHWPPEASTSRVTTVMPGVATISCPRWLPNDIEQSEELFHGDYQRIQFAELWLTVDQDNKDDDDKSSTAATKKVGLFVAYNGVTGELHQVFTMRDISLSNNNKDAKNNDNLLPYDVSINQHPAQVKWDLAKIRAILQEKGQWPILLPENAGERAFVHSDYHKSIPAFLDKRRWTHLTGRVVQTDSAAGQSRAASIHNQIGCTFCRPIPSEDEAELYFDEHCPDGLYFVIPKTFHPTHLSEEALIELGCVTVSRILSFRDSTSYFPGFCFWFPGFLL
jgi:hypothetical protein